MDDKIRQMAIDIIDMFEDLLEKHNINIPDEERDGHEGEANIYGITYFELEDEITAYLKDKTK